MPEKIHCTTHGERQKTYVCNHLSGNGVALGFNRSEPDEENPFPDAWCDDCELIRAAHGGWNEESEKLITLSLLCSGCYERARIRNTRPEVTLDDLAGMRWKCTSCEEWHTGPVLDIGVDAPHYWSDEYEEENRHAQQSPGRTKKRPATFLTEDFCAIENRDFFVYGLIHLPIIGTGETFRWGVWGSLSRENFEKLLEIDDDPKRVELPPMFAWLSTRLPDYPDTLNLKMYAHIQELNQRPNFELEPADHPLSQEYHHGITPERVKEIMLRHLHEVE
jgi:hypothetical protein